MQGRNYASMFGLVERLTGAKILEASGDYLLGDETALEALVRFTDGEMKQMRIQSACCPVFR